MKKLILLLAVASLIAPAVAGAAHPINDLVNLAVPVNSDGSRLSPEEVQAAIIEGSSARGWSPVVEVNGVITATITVRGKHFAKVEIPFDSASYSILYVDSDNLDYNESRRTIHRNYNNWVFNLSETINQKFREVPQPGASSAETIATAPASENSTEDVYSKLLRLDELRENGILTEEEFQAEKRKLLEQD
jgi:hypothetical protein